MEARKAKKLSGIYVIIAIVLLIANDSFDSVLVFFGSVLSFLLAMTYFWIGRRQDDLAKETKFTFNVKVRRSMIGGSSIGLIVFGGAYALLIINQGIKAFMHPAGMILLFIVLLSIASLWYAIRKETLP
ncbi:MAG: hypothetical protein ABIH34_05240 [Nanoarchaeota archaeon]